MTTAPCRYSTLDAGRASRIAAAGYRQSTVVDRRRWRRLAAYALAVAGPMTLGALMQGVASWPRPYSWQYLGVSLAVAIIGGTGPGLIALCVATLWVLRLGVPTPVHPGVEMFVAIDLALLALLYHSRRTRQKIAEEMSRLAGIIRRDHAFLRTVVDSTPSLIVVRDREGRCLLANEAAARFHGTTAHALEGRGARETPMALPSLLEQDAEVLRTGKEIVSDEMDAIGADGVVHSFLNVKTPLANHDGVVDRVLTTSVDITWRKRAEAALTEANARLAEADRRKDEFIAVLSHELRNPLAPIRYAVPVLQCERLSEHARRAIAVIDRQTDHLTRLVDDLLDVSRITRGKIELRREHVTLGSIVTAGSEAASPAILAARHRLELRVSDEPIWLHADLARMSQVVTNLLDNSAKYTPHGGRIVLEAQREDDHAVIRVRDNGVGIPPEELRTVFEMFRQVDGDDKSQGGLGIGLALVRQLVELHDGSIEARSGGIGQGAEFIIRLPLAEEIKPQPAARHSEARADGRPLRVLVVDDNADLLEMLTMVVTGLGHDVRKALDGRSAVSAAKLYRPDVVLLDLGLPVMSGLEVARQLRRDPATAGALLVALTGWGQAEDRARTTEAGFDHHLTKPTEPEILQKLLDRAAHEPHAARQPL